MFYMLEFYPELGIERLSANHFASTLFAVYDGVAYPPVKMHLSAEPAFGLGSG